MKKLFNILCFFLVSTSLFAEVATLQHDNDIQVFYNINALDNALSAAQNGDIINLSSGYFLIKNINKAVTIIGVGMENDTINNIGATHIYSGDEGAITYIKQPTDTAFLKFEGICFDNKIYPNSTMYNVTATRCKFTNLFDWSSSPYKWVNGNFINCLFTTSSFGYMYGNCTFINCYLNSSCHASEDEAHTYINSIVKLSSEGSSYRLGKSTFQNCIVISEGDYAKVRNTSCVGISLTNHLSYPLGNVYRTVKSYSDIFKTFNGTYSEGEKFELTESAASKWLGNDGSQVGINGGVVPFDSKPTNIQIESCTVDKQTDAEGKLNVSIKLKK